MRNRNLPTLVALYCKYPAHGLYSEAEGCGEAIEMAAKTPPRLNARNVTDAEAIVYRQGLPASSMQSQAERLESMYVARIAHTVFIRLKISDKKFSGDLVKYGVEFVVSTDRTRP